MSIVVIMAGGLGKRMNSDLPKVLHKIADKPMLIHVISQALLHRPKRKMRQNIVMVYIFYNYASSSLLNVPSLFLLLIYFLLFHVYLHKYFDFLF